MASHCTKESAYGPGDTESAEVQPAPGRTTAAACRTEASRSVDPGAAAHTHVGDNPPTTRHSRRLGQANSPPPSSNNPPSTPKHCPERHIARKRSARTSPPGPSPHSHRNSPQATTRKSSIPRARSDHTHSHTGTAPSRSPPSSAPSASPPRATYSHSASVKSR